MKKFIARIYIFGMLSALLYVLIAILTGVLYNEPILTTSISFDKKMQFLKKNESQQINVLAIGSSMTLNNFNSKTIETNYDIDGKYLNLGAWGLQMTDILTLTKYFTEKYSPRLIIICSSLTDFEVVNSYFKLPNKKSLDDYFKRNNLELFLSKNGINSYIERDFESEYLESGNSDYESLKFDKYGSVYLEIPKNKIDTARWNRPIKEPKEIQYSALEEIVNYLHTKYIGLVFVQCPIKLRSENIDTDRKIINNHLLRINKIINSSGNQFINLFNEYDFTEKDFCDTYHLNNNASEKFTKMVIDSINLTTYFK